MEQSVIVAESAALLADRSRATVLLTLLDGRAYTANELACAANVSPQTASFHLGKLLDAAFIDAVRQGRHRYFRLSGPDVAQALETLLATCHVRSPKAVPTRCPTHLRNARCCYDHLAGRLGVEVYRAMLRDGWLAPGGARLAAAPAVATLLEMLDIDDDRASLRAKPCLDWSEREFHLAGDLGRVLLRGMLDKRWLLRGRARAVTLTEEGRRRLRSLNLDGRAPHRGARSRGRRE